jgi:O-succinylbenzoate synthase
LVTPFRTSFGTETEKDVVVVRALGGDDEPDGWGECVALSEPTYSSEYAAGAHDVLLHHLLPRVVAGRSMHDVVGHPMAKAAVEMARLDRSLRTSGESLSAWLGADRRYVDSGVSVGMQPTAADLVRVVEGYLAEGYRRIKCKIEPGWDVEPMRAVRSAVGPDVLLQVDANAAYSFDDPDGIAALHALDDLDLLLIEQPLPEDDLQGHARLAAQLRTPLCLDESITSVRTCEEALDLGACSIVNIKAGRVGGLATAVRIHDLCLERGVPVWCGGMLETGLGRAANLALAALPGFTLPGDLSASRRWFAEDLTEPFELEDGRLRVPTGPGLGVEPRPDVLAERTVSVTLVR